MSAQRTRALSPRSPLAFQRGFGSDMGGRRRPCKTPRRAMHWAAAGAVCAAIAIGMGIWLWPGAGRQTPPVQDPALRHDEKQRKAQPADCARGGVAAKDGRGGAAALPAPKNGIVARTNAVAEADGTAARTNAVVVGDGPERGWLVGAVTNADGGVVERWRLEDGRRMKRVLPPRRVFSHASDEIIALALSGDGASELPPMPTIGPAEEEAFRRSLATPIRDDPADDERTRETKRRVREARAEIARRMGEGETFAEVIASHVAARAELEKERRKKLEMKSEE